MVWAKQAEIAQKYLHKGSLIYLEGRIQSREWQDKEGNKRTSFEIVCTNFRMLGGRAEAGRGDSSHADSSHAAAAGATSDGGDFEHAAPPAGDDLAPHGGPEISDEDIPF